MSECKFDLKFNNEEDWKHDCRYAIFYPWQFRKDNFEDGWKRVSIDKCLLDEVVVLWEHGIKTAGNCCGHGKDEPVIWVYDEFIPRMKELGYEVWPHYDGSGREDGFLAKTIVPKNGYTQKKTYYEYEEKDKNEGGL